MLFPGDRERASPYHPSDRRFLDPIYLDIDAIADIATSVNSTVENIGARRLHTVMERVLDEVSFAASDKAGETVKIDAAYVKEHIGDLTKNADLTKFIL